MSLSAINELPPFPGFRPAAFDFLRTLAEHNDRAWFKPRKALFEDEVLWPFRCLVTDAARQATYHNLPLTGDPDRSIFRIYRDTRFSKNKDPYKTHVGAVLSRSGGRNEEGVVYIHIEPGHSFLGGGFWRPATPLLRAWRRRLAEDPASFREVVRQLAASGLQLETDDALKRLPRGFEDRDDPDVGAFLRWKSFLVTRSVSDTAAQSPDFTQAVVQMMRDARPLLEYGWQLLDEA